MKCTSVMRRLSSKSKAFNAIQWRDPYHGKHGEKNDYSVWLFLNGLGTGTSISNICQPPHYVFYHVISETGHCIRLARYELTVGWLLVADCLATILSIFVSSQKGLPLFIDPESSGLRLLGGENTVCESRPQPIGANADEISNSPELISEFTNHLKCFGDVLGGRDISLLAFTHTHTHTPLTPTPTTQPCFFCVLSQITCARSAPMREDVTCVTYSHCRRPCSRDLTEKNVLHSPSRMAACTVPLITPHLYT